jgi:hypothetical protein
MVEEVAKSRQSRDDPEIVNDDTSTIALAERNVEIGSDEDLLAGQITEIFEQRQTGESSAALPTVGHAPTRRQRSTRRLE